MAYFFYKIRQISTGLFFDGGERFAPTFSAIGMRYNSQSGLTAALRSIERRRHSEKALQERYNATFRESHPPTAEAVAAVDRLFEERRPENLEIVELTETVLRVVPKNENQS
jgi:hypothetical protein